MASRPERVAPPEIFYDDTEARKYTSSSRIIDIQVLLNFNFLSLFQFNSFLMISHIIPNRPHSQNEHWSYSLYLKTVFPNYSLTLVLYFYFNFNSFSFFNYHIHLVICVGCGSGLSGETLSEEGHHWIGLDISPSMLSMFSFSSIFDKQLNLQHKRFCISYFYN